MHSKDQSMNDNNILWSDDKNHSSVGIKFTFTVNTLIFFYLQLKNLIFYNIKKSFFCVVF